jgi:Galactose oxidase, central domain
MKKQPTISNPSARRRLFRPVFIARLRPASSILARRIAFPLLLLSAGLMLVQPSAGQNGTWITTGSLLTAREGPTATLVPNGKVLVAAGYNPIDGWLASAELYDPATGTWTATGDLATRWQGARRRRTGQLRHRPRDRGTLRPGEWNLGEDRQARHWTLCTHGDAASQRPGARCSRK